MVQRNQIYSQKICNVLILQLKKVFFCKYENGYIIGSFMHMGFPNTHSL